MISSDRVNNAAPVTMRGGTLNFLGRAQTASSETLNGLAIAQGSSQLTVTAGGTGVNSADLSFTTLTRSNSATLNISGVAGQLGSAGRLLVGTINGVSTSTVGGGLVNNIIGGWAVANGVDFVTYVPGLGLAPLGSTGAAAYDATALSAAGGGTLNVKLSNASFAVPDINPGVAGTYFLNSLNYVSNATAQTLSFADANDTLNLTSGGFSKSGTFTSVIGSAVGNGKLTAGGSVSVPGGVAELIINNNVTNLAMTVNSAIVDNAASGDAVRLVYTPYNGASLVLAGTNTYSGGTVVNANNVFTGTLNIGATGTLPAGGLTINTATVTQTAGGVITPQAVTINGQGTLTLTGSNTLTSLTFNNNGGGNSTVTPGVAADTLKLTGGINSNPTNVGGIATIGTGNLDLNANNSFPITVAATLINGSDVAPWQSGLTINSVVINGGIAKAGAGMLQLGGASTFTGGVMVNAGGLVLALDSTPSTSLATVTSGPLGTGTLTLASGTSLVATATRIIANNVVFQGTGAAGATVGSNTFNGTANLTLNGTTSLPNTWNATITAPQMTVSIPNVVGSVSTDVINKSGLGVLTLTGSYLGTLQTSGGVAFLTDGNTLGSVENIVIGSSLNATGNISLTVSHSSSAPNALNKNVQDSTLSIGASTLAVTNSNGYGLEFTGATTLTGTPSINVANATNSNVVQALTLSGQVTGAGFGLIKTGTGTLALSNATNNFGGAGSIVEIRKGVLSINSDGALGDPANSLLLNINGATLVGLRATGTFTTNRAITLNQASDAIEVTAGNVFTIGSSLTIPTAATVLTKNDDGVLELAASNSGSSWSNAAGGLIINAGAVRLSNSTAAGLATNKIIVNAAVGAALQLSGGVNIANPVILNNVANETTRSGLNSGGSLESVAGNNTYSGLIATLFDSGVGADAGATLNLTGGIDNTGGRQISFYGAGTINLASAILNASPFQVNKFGAGTVNFTTAQTLALGASTGLGLQVNAGTVSINTAGSLGVAAVGGLNVNPGGTLAVDDSLTTPVANRLGNSALTLNGGSFIYTGNTAGSSEVSSGALNIAVGAGTITSNQTGAGAVAITFATFGPAADTSFTLAGANIGTANNKITFTTAPTTVPATTGILARGITGAGFDFVSYNNTGAAVNAFGLQAFANYNATSATNLNSAAATDTVNVNAGMTTASLTASKTINALKITGTGLTVGGSAFTTLTLTAAGIAATGATGTGDTISVPILSVGAVQVIYHVDSGSTLNLNSTLTGTAGFVKADPGVLVLNAPANDLGIANTTANLGMTGTHNLLGGTLRLGANNAIAQNSFLRVGPGGILDLNGKTQFLQGLFTNANVPQTSPGSLGSIIGSGNLITNLDNNARSWAGSISGASNFTRSGQNTWNVFSDQPYTGTTLINGGTTVLLADGALSGTTAIALNYATLTLDNNSATGTAGLSDKTNRINDAATIAMRGGTLNFTGRTNTASTETVGSTGSGLTLVEGANFVTPAVNVTAGTQVGSADLTITTLTRNTGGGTLNFTSATAGLIGNSARVIIPTITVNGTPTSTATAGGGLTNGIIGGWATIGTSDWATYIPGLGIAPMGVAGAFQYSTNVLAPSNLATDNININYTTATAGITSNTTINSLKTSNIVVASVPVSAGATLTLGTGGFLNFTSTAYTIGNVVNQGFLTSGGTELFAYTQGGGTPTINAVIKDGLAGDMGLVKSGANTLTLAATNTYHGGTTVEQGTLNIATTGLIPAATVPANGLIINNATVTATAPGVIASSNIVTLNSNAATLNLFGNNTLAGLVFGAAGGTSNPTINTFTGSSIAGGYGTLTLGASGIVSTSQDVQSISFIDGRVDFGASLNTVNVGAINVNGATDISPLQRGFTIRGIVNSAGGINKTGAGVFELQAQETFTGALNVTAGGVKLGVANAGSRYANLNLSTSASRLDLSAFSTTLGALEGSGIVFDNGAAATLTVGFNGNSTTFSGTIGRYNDATLTGVSLTKIGGGTMHMTSAQNTTNGSTGTVTVSGGTLSFEGAGAWFTGVTTPVAIAETFTVNAGGTVALDSTGGNVNNRLGLIATGTLNLNGGTLAITGNGTAATPTSETDHHLQCDHRRRCRHSVSQRGQPVEHDHRHAQQPERRRDGAHPGHRRNGGGQRQRHADHHHRAGSLRRPGRRTHWNFEHDRPCGHPGGCFQFGPGHRLPGQGHRPPMSIGHSAEPPASPPPSITPSRPLGRPRKTRGSMARPQTLSTNGAINTLTVGGATGSLSTGLSTTAFGTFTAGGTTAAFGPSGVLTLNANSAAVLVLNGSNLYQQPGFQQRDGRQYADRPRRRHRGFQPERLLRHRQHLRLHQDRRRHDEPQQPGVRHGQRWCGRQRRYARPQQRLGQHAPGGSRSNDPDAGRPGLAWHLDGRGSGQQQSGGRSHLERQPAARPERPDHQHRGRDADPDLHRRRHLCRSDRWRHRRLARQREPRLHPRGQQHHAPDQRQHLLRGDHRARRHPPVARLGGDCQLHQREPAIRHAARLTNRV